MSEIRCIHQTGAGLTEYEYQSSGIRKKILNTSLVDLLREFSRRSLTDWTYLLDEKHFDYASFSISLEIAGIFGIHDLKKIIDEKVSLLKTRYISSPYVIHYLSHISIDQQECDYVLGATGFLSFTLHLYLLRADMVTTFQLLGGKEMFSSDDLAIYPKSFFLMRHLQNQLGKSNFALLYIWDNLSQLTLINEGGYQEIQEMSLGSRLLRSCYEEHDIGKYFYQGYEEIEANEFLKKLVAEACSFFTEQVMKWVAGYVDAQTDVIVISDVLRNPAFVPSLQHAFHEYSEAFFLPLHKLEGTGFSDFGSSDLNVWAYFLAQQK